MGDPGTPSPPQNRAAMGLQIGFNLFPSEGPPPAARPSAAGLKAAPTLEYDRSAGRAKIIQAQVNLQLSFWKRNSHWLAPLIVLGIGWSLFAIKFLWIGNPLFLVLVQPALALYLAFRSLIGLVICFLGMKILHDDLGSPLAFPLQIIAATTLAAAVGFVVPYVGIFLLEPILLLWMFCWLLEVPGYHGLLYAGATLAIYWGIVIRLLSGQIIIF